MTLPHDTLMDLMSLADGELDGEARLRAERLVAESEEARRAYEGFRAPHVGLWLSDAFDRRAAGAGADSIADAVMASVRAEGSVPARVAGAASVAKVVRMGDASPRRAPRRALLVASALGATAMAAGVAFFVHSASRPAGEQMPMASVGMPSVDMQRPPAEGTGAQGVEVDEVDSPSRGISVFEIPLAPLVGAAANVGARSGSSVVVWIDDEGAK